MPAVYCDECGIALNPNDDDIYTPTGGALCEKHRPAGGFKEYADLEQENAALLQVARRALADLVGVMPEFEPSGDRRHPAWVTIAELATVISQVQGDDDELIRTAYALLLPGNEDEPTTRGQRVGAILSVGREEKIVCFLGYGVHVGDSVPEEAVGWLAEICREYGFTNPRVELDDGQTVYGCECWWGGEVETRRELAKYEAAGYTIRQVSIADVRREHRDAVRLLAV